MQERHRDQHAGGEAHEVDAVPAAPGLEVADGVMPMPVTSAASTLAPNAVQKVFSICVAPRFCGCQLRPFSPHHDKRPLTVAAAQGLDFARLHQ